MDASNDSSAADCGFGVRVVVFVTRLKDRRGPYTDLRTKRLLETTASLMSAIGQHHRDRIMAKAKRWK